LIHHHQYILFQNSNSTGMASKKTVASKTVVPDGGDQVTVGGGETEHGDQDTCSICLEVLPVFGHEFIRLTCCGNALHFECGSRLGKEKCGLACPMCRAPTDVADETRHAQALRWADQGKAWAMFVVGTSYMSGLGVLQSDETARLWLQRAAELGHPGAQFNLGNYHQEGVAVPKSMQRARVLYEKAADQGHPMAQFNLGLLHQLGEGGPVSKEKARYWYEKAALQGELIAQINLSAMYATDPSGPSFAQARFWGEKAALQGDRDAQFNLAMMHHKGQGGPVSIKHARFWYTKAAMQGDPTSQFNVGLMHAQEPIDGVQSLEHIAFWWMSAVEQGSENAVKHLPRIKAKCFGCRSAKDIQMKQCVGCKSAFYCSKQCQKVAWMKDHKKKCKQIRALKTEMEAQVAASALKNSEHGRGIHGVKIKIVKKL
jgi:uncharacterized protein